MNHWTILAAVALTALVIGGAAGEARDHQKAPREAKGHQKTPHVAIVNPSKTQMILYLDFPHGSCLLYGDK